MGTRRGTADAVARACAARVPRHATQQRRALETASVVARDGARAHGPAHLRVLDGCRQPARLRAARPAQRYLYHRRPTPFRLSPSFDNALCAAGTQATSHSKPEKIPNGDVALTDRDRAVPGAVSFSAPHRSTAASRSVPSAVSAVRSTA